jgi:hypothetical protein
MRRFNYTAFALALAAALVALVCPAPAALDLSTGVRYVIPAGTMDECATKAQTALSAYLMNTKEAAPGANEWIAVGPIGATNAQAMTASGTVHCYAQGKGYAVTFTCSVELPANPYSAADLCLDIAHNFSGKPQTALATPPPPATGCNTQNLIGTWTDDNDKSKSFKMEDGGELTDADGVSGNWILYGDTATLTIYGNHSLKLSPDGKHLTGSGWSLTRKC